MAPGGAPRAEDLSEVVLEPGAVALVGGGPGALDLLTVRGLALLQQADVVVVDRLGPAGIVDLLGEDVEIIRVGKTPGRPSMRQHEIEEVLVAQARAGRRVVRLKGGDPFLLGRGGEEVLACAAAGVPVQVVPGVTSAIAGPAAGGIPVTHRGTAVAVHIVNAHGDLGPADLAAIADPGTTTVLMMGVGWLPRLVSQALLNGISPEVPVAVVQNATMEGQRQVHGTLGTIERIVQEQRIGFPAVIVVGRTAADGFLVPPEPAEELHGSGREALREPAPAGPTALVPTTEVTAAGESAARARASRAEAVEVQRTAEVRRAAGPVLVGCAHGTRSRAGRDVIRSLLMQVHALLPQAEVREAYVDVQSPELEEVVREVARPLGDATRTRRDDEVEAVVVPLLLSTGYHVGHDVAAAVDGFSALAAAPLGPDPRLATVMAERLAEAGLGPDDAVVMAVAGTRESAGQQMASRMAALLARELGREVTTAFIAAAAPTVPEAVAAARTGLPAGGRVVVASYLLVPGYFQSVLEGVGADAVAAPLGDHPLVAEIVVDRFRAAVGA
ncbi:uroporphyrinogen-III C-methyltransferase [Brachybacterium sp. DNPG3]